MRDAFLPASVIPNPHRAAYYSNVSGIARGDAKFYNISPSSELSPYQKLSEAFVTGYNATQAEEMNGAWNWTALTKSSVKFSEIPTDPAANITEDVFLARVSGYSLSDCRPPANFDRHRDA